MTNKFSFVLFPLLFFFHEFAWSQSTDQCVEELKWLDSKMWYLRSRLGPAAPREVPGFVSGCDPAFDLRCCEMNLQIQRNYIAELQGRLDNLLGGRGSDFPSGKGYPYREDETFYPDDRESYIPNQPADNYPRNDRGNPETDLRFQSGNLPIGSYRQTCRNCTYTVKELQCECRTINGEWTKTSASECSSYVNIDGELDCE